MDSYPFVLGIIFLMCCGKSESHPYFSQSLSLCGDKVVAIYSIYYSTELPKNQYIQGNSLKIQNRFGIS